MTRRMNIHLLLAGLAMLKEGLLRCCCCRVEREVISDLCGISSWWAMKILSSLSFFLESGHLQSNWYRKQQESERESGLSNLRAHLCDWNWLTSTSVSSSLKCYCSSWFSCCAVFKNQELKKITVYSSSVGCAGTAELEEAKITLTFKIENGFELSLLRSKMWKITCISYPISSYSFPKSHTCLEAQFSRPFSSSLVLFHIQFRVWCWGRTRAKSVPVVCK